MRKSSSVQRFFCTTRSKKLKTTHKMLKYSTLIIFNTLSLTKPSRIGGYNQGLNHDLHITRHTNCEELFPTPDFSSNSRVNCQKRVSINKKVHEKLKEKASDFLKTKNIKTHNSELIARHRLDSNICDSEPCYNGGGCEALDDGNSFMCYCGHLFYGPLCERHACSGEPCGAHGRCQLDVDDKYDFECSCEEGFSGKQCEIDEKGEDGAEKCAYFDHNGECVV